MLLSKGSVAASAWVVIALTLSPSPVCAVAQAAQSAERVGRVPEPGYVDSVVTSAMQRLRVPGAVITIASQGKIVHSKGYGYSDVKRRVPVSASETAFRVGSITKVFTALAALQLIEHRKLDLRGNVNSYTRAVAIDDKFPEPVTIAHLLTHTSGLDELNRGRHAKNAADVKPLGGFLRNRLVRVRAPGEISSYGTYGMALAGHLVEEVSGLSYHEYLSRSIFTPLGMRRASVAAFPSAVPATPATGYAWEAGRFVPQPFEFFHTYPASDVNATGADMGLFMIALLEGGANDHGRILSPDGMGEMQQQHFTHHPRLAGWAYGLRELYQHGHRALWHGGGMKGFSALLFTIPEQRWGVFIAMNCESPEFGEEVKNALMAHLFPYLPQPDPVPPVDRQALSRFVGTYRSTEYCHTCSGMVERWLRNRLAPPFRITADGDSALKLWGERLISIEPLLFSVAGDKGYVAFRTDSTGQVQYLLAGQSSFERMH